MTTPRILSMLREFGLSNDRIAELVDVTGRQVLRWDKGEAEPRFGYRERLIALDHLITELQTIFTADDAMLWLLRPNPHLSGRSPYRAFIDGKLAAVQRAADRVIQVGREAQDGVPA